MQPVFIYALKDPTTGLIRYVGKAAHPKKRLNAHVASCRAENNHRSNWVKSLLDLGLRPVLEILDEVPESEWPQWEVAYIEFFRELGCRLVNGTVGGEGGQCPTEETRAKQRAAKLGKKLSPEHCARLGESRKGKKRSPEYCAAFGKSRQGKNHPMFGKKHSAEANEKNRVANSGEKNGMFGKQHSAETLTKMRATKRAKREEKSIWPN